MTPHADEFVRSVFSEVPETYEFLNHALTLGFDVAWRKRAAALAAEAGGRRWADMCTGTGETAVYLRRLAPEATTVYAVDFSLPMMEVARKKPTAGRIEFVEADVKALPFDDGSLDAVTMSFATRNLNLSEELLLRSFAEFHRVLRPGGLFVNLETSRPLNPVVRKCFHSYVKLLVEPLGTRVSGSRAAYAYLASTIPRFHGAEELAGIMRAAGFDDVTYRRFLLGVAAIHRGVRR